VAVKTTSVYLTGSEWVLTSMSRTTAGVWVANLTIHRLIHTCGDGELGGAVLQSLEASVLDLPHPASLPEHNRKYRQSLGVVSYDRFIAGSRLLAAHRLGDAVVLTPHRNRGPERGFEPLANKLTVPAADALVLGEAVRRWAGQCQ
jgi:hypothetical protein